MQNIFQRSVSIPVCTSCLPNRGVIHHRTLSFLPGTYKLHFWCGVSFKKKKKKKKTCDSDDIARSSLQTLIEDSILASGVLSVGYSLLEQVAVIFLAPTGAHKQTPPPELPPHVPVEGCENPRGGCFPAACRPKLSLVFSLATDRADADKAVIVL